MIIAVPSDPRKRTPQIDAKKERKRRKYRGMLVFLGLFLFYFIFQKGTCTRLLTESQISLDASQDPILLLFGPGTLTQLRFLEKGQTKVHARKKKSGSVRSGYHTLNPMKKRKSKTENFLSKLGLFSVRL